MTRQELEKLIEDAALRFAQTHDPREQDEVARLTVKLAEVHNVEVLARAVARCRNEDIRTHEVQHALDFLAYRAAAKAPFEQFRIALNNGDNETRWQVLNASLKDILQALGIEQETPADPRRKKSQ